MFPMPSVAYVTNEVLSGTLNMQASTGLITVTREPAGGMHRCEQHAKLFRSVGRGSVHAGKVDASMAARCQQEFCPRGNIAVGPLLHKRTRVQHSTRIATMVHETLVIQGRGQFWCAPGACSMHMLQSP